MSLEATFAPKVLVVEDEPDLRELLTYNLTAAGFTVEVTENGTDGLAAVQRFAPDADGFAVAKWVDGNLRS